ncbi:MAG: alpha/beta hydrolase [Flavobacteriaceae bacterium]|nr:alpha/beta hydrolase [Flavobacteriaceae bacterium]
MPYINLKNARLYYEDHGKGDETIVFGHSMLFNLRMFDDQVNYLKQSYRCVSFDFRGQGKSEVTKNGYDLDTLTEDIAELIKNLDCFPCHFIGFSMGGMIALRLAVKHPELIKSLVLIDTSSETEPTENMKQNQLMTWIARHLGIRLVANRVMSMFFGNRFLNDPKRIELKRTWKNHLLANDRIGMTRAIKGVMTRKGLSQLLHKINFPTLILVGSNDILTTYDKAEIMNNGIKKSSLEVIPYAGHMSPVEEPKIVNELISHFLNSSLLF